MLLKNPEDHPLLIWGNHSIAGSLMVCLLQAGHPVTWVTTDTALAWKQLRRHLEAMPDNLSALYPFKPEIVTALPPSLVPGLAIVVTDENVHEKCSAIGTLQGVYGGKLPILINSESITLSCLQGESAWPEQVYLANWCDPVHTTFFLELVTNSETTDTLLQLEHYGRRYWQKDPYIIRADKGIRSLLRASLMREALHLVEHGYASIPDIDRACRNDPGYYLPFAGHFRYMDLMGTAAYGMVMKDLNPELSRTTELPGFVTELVRKNSSFYELTGEQQSADTRRFETFSFEIKAIIEKYPAL